MTVTMTSTKLHKSSGARNMCITIKAFTIVSLRDPNRELGVFGGLAGVCFRPLSGAGCSWHRLAGAWVADAASKWDPGGVLVAAPGLR